MKKNSFTLIELIGVITILSLILLISLPSLTATLNSSKEKRYNEFLNDLYIAAENYVVVNKDDFPQLENVNGGLFIKLETLITNGYISNTKKDPKTNKEIDSKSTIRVLRDEDNTYKYKYFEGDYTNNGYVMDKLKLMYDGYNMSNNIITDLVGNNNGIMANFVNGWQGNKIKFDGNDDYLNNIYNISSSNLTIQMVLEYQEGSYVLFKNSTNTLGLYVVDNYLSLNSVNNVINNNYSDSLVCLTVIADTNETKLFVNNELISTLQGSSIEKLQLFTDGGSSNFKGSLFAVRIYEKILNTNELQNNYNLDMGRYNK